MKFQVVYLYIQSLDINFEEKYVWQNHGMV